MKKLTVIGLFCQGKEVSDGQSIKTRILTDELEKYYGKEKVQRIDTYSWKKKPFKLFLSCIAAVSRSENVIFMTDDGGIKVFPWLLLLPNFIFKRKLHYVVIGGWLVPFLKKHKFISACLKKFDYIFPETTLMKKGLEAQGFKNVCILPNFKNIPVLKESELPKNFNEPYRFCTFSRVMKEKGIEAAAEAVKNINEKFGRAVCTLDIYGAIDHLEKEWFENLKRDFPPEVKYCGVVPFDKSVDTLKNYFALLFPTSYLKEGIPGTVIDAYSAGLPVIASKWSGFQDMVEEKVTGIGYPWLEDEKLQEKLTEVLKNPKFIFDMKINCLKKAESYRPENIIKILLKKLS